MATVSFAPSDTNKGPLFRNQMELFDNLWRWRWNEWKRFEMYGKADAHSRWDLSLTQAEPLPQIYFQPFTTVFYFTIIMTKIPSTNDVFASELTSYKGHFQDHESSIHRVLPHHNPVLGRASPNPHLHASSLSAPPSHTIPQTTPQTEWPFFFFSFFFFLLPFLTPYPYIIKYY